MYNVATIISGRGSTFMAFYEAWKRGQMPGVNPALLISTNSKAKGLERARFAGFLPDDIVVIPKSAYETPQFRGEAILEECLSRRVDLIALMGCLMIVPDNVHNRILTINQHPARLPEFAGLDGLTAHAAVINYCKKLGRPMLTEPTVHVVTSVLDGGPILDTRLVPVFPEDTPEGLDARVIPVEHELVQAVIRRLAEGNLDPFEQGESLANTPEERQFLIEAVAGARAWAEGVKA